MTTVPALASVVESLAHAAAPWKDLYDDSTALSVAVVFAHLASLLVGGGLALATDRATLRAARDAGAERERQLAQLAQTHRTVVGALVVSFVSGVLLFLADVETFAVSPAFWTKMALVALLLLNGLVMSRAESALRRGGAAGDGAAWGRLRATAVVSAVLWLGTLFAGVVLTNA